MSFSKSHVCGCRLLWTLASVFDAFLVCITSEILVNKVSRVKVLLQLVGGPSFSSEPSVKSWVERVCEAITLTFKISSKNLNRLTEHRKPVFDIT